MILVNLKVVCHRCGNEEEAGSSLHPYPNDGFLHGVFTPDLPDGWQIWEEGPICRWCLGAIADLPCLAEQQSTFERMDQERKE